MAGKPLHVVSPLLESTPLRQRDPSIGTVYLKMDSVQPVGSFKIRGIGYKCQLDAERGKRLFISSSGGNAGSAVAYAGRKLGIPTTVVVPSSTSEVMVKKIEAEGAKVIVAGKFWDEANAYALKLLQDEPQASYIPPFDHPEIWVGNSSLVDEIQAQLDGARPDVIVCSVGGGGMLNGLVHGLRKGKCFAVLGSVERKPFPLSLSFSLPVGWSDVPIVAMETVGAESFNLAVKADRLVTKDSITSIAKTLGALTVSAESFRLSKIHPIISHVVTDEAAIRACVLFADDHRTLVEPSCGATLAAVYEPGLLKKLVPSLTPQSKVVTIVCGGQLTSPQLLQEWAAMLGKSKL